MGIQYDMNDSSQNERCPCGSGLNYDSCCGVPERTAVNAGIFAKVTKQGIESNQELTPELQSAIDSFEFLSYSASLF